MKKFLLILTIISLWNVSAQTEKPNYKIISAQFETLYNNKDYAAIFSLFSTDMQKALPLDKTTELLSSVQAQAGKINKREFIQYDKSYAIYKTTSEKTVFALNMSVDDNSKINGFLIRPYIDQTVPKPERNDTKLALPFKGEWTVIWGGDTKELNYHVKDNAQKNAFDLIIKDSKEKSYKTDGIKNEDYYAFGKELFAPCDGEVVLTVDGIKDNKPGILNPIYTLGNTVIIKTIKNEYLIFAHFKQNSIQVKQGQQIKQGHLLGLCGNSGNSSEPHIHFHIQNVEDLNIATGIKCYFDRIIVDGKSKFDYSPMQAEKIKPQE